jgi:hypothetical protein
MRSIQHFIVVLGVFLVAAPLASQNVNTMHPQQIEAQKLPSPEDLRAKSASAQFQKDVKELAELCASVASDMDRVKQGLLAKDAPEKLKRMEKLSKRVREGLSQTPTQP